MWWLHVLGLVGCVPRAPVLPTPVGAGDGNVLQSPAAVVLAVLGDASDLAPVVADVRSRAPALLVLTGDAVRRGSAAEWDQVTRLVAALPTVPIPGDGERRSDPQLKTYAEVWSGLGVRGVDLPVPWRHVDVVTDGVRWRLVVVDADQQGLGDRWRDQMFWLPKALGGRYDRLIVLANHPPMSLSTAFEPREGPKRILELIRAHAPPAALVAWVAGGDGTTELILPTGRWNEAVVVTGCSDRSSARTLRRSSDTATLPPGLVTGLIGEFHRWRANGGHDPTELEEGADFAPPDFPVCGWWEVTLHGDQLALALRMRRFNGDTWSSVWTANWAPDTGWLTETDQTEASAANP